jgi:uncharacterized protein YecE (DUF72 family)
MQLYLGCPVWSFKGWVGNFYPEGTKASEYLREYTRRLTTIEGNTTFYAVPAQKTLEQWAAEMPGTFRFCPKIPKAISHAGTLADHLERARAFVDVMNGLGSRLGPMFLQLPPRYAPRLFDDLQAFLEAWPAGTRLGVEVRHMDWFESPHSGSLDRLLADLNMARVVIDTRPIRSLEGEQILAGSVYQALLEARQRKPDIPVQDVPAHTADFTFLRYIGHPHIDVNRPFLEEWGNSLVSQLHQGVEAFVFCHSPENLTAPWLCRDLHARVAARVSIPPLPWDETDAGSFEQGRLF